MKNRTTRILLTLVLVASSAVFSSANRKDEVTLVMVPREDAVVQLGMDIANRYPTLLVSYLIGANETASLHGWSGTQWVNITLDDFRGGNFFRTGPDSVLIVEKDGVSVLDSMIPPPEWCMNVSRITTDEIRPLLHLVGQYYDFSFKEWSWFAKRYGLELDAINPEGLNVAWYNKRMNEHFKSEGPSGPNDLRFWESIRQAVPEEPVALAEEAPVDPGTNAVEEVSGNLLTNEVPSAVIMGAADASEEQVAPPVAQEETKSKAETAEESEEMQ